MEKRYILGLDEGTSSAKAVVYDTHKNEIVHVETMGFRGYFPKPGYVEQDALEIYSAQVTALKKAVVKKNISPEQVYAIGITNQRETIVAWDDRNGEPVYNAIVWQCKRTSAQIKRMTVETKNMIHEKTGLIPDSYFSATKIQWIIDNVPKAKQILKEGHLKVGTIECFLAWKLTGAFVTDITNASRTMLVNISTLDYDDKLLKYFKIPRKILPDIISNCEEVGKTDILGAPIPICSMIGDQQAALFGQACLHKGMAKNTYGTGSFLLINIGKKPYFSKNHLLTTVAWKIGDEVTYALEGSVFNAGSAVSWLRDVGLIKKPQETEALATSVTDSAGVYMVPAFSGLGAPYWDMDARGIIVGITRGTKRSHIVRATLESVAYATNDLIHEIKQDGLKIEVLRVDGGGSENNFTMQFQSDISNIKVEAPTNYQTTSLGAIYLAGLASGAFKSLEEIESLWVCDKEFMPNMDRDIAKELKLKWKDAVQRSLHWN